MADFVTALALVLVLEGLLWAGFPARMQALAAQAATLPAQLLRRMGVGAMAVGVILVWMLRG